MQNIKKYSPSLLCLVLALVIKDLLAGLNQPVFLLLMIVMLIPFAVLFRKSLERNLDNKTAVFLLFLTFFYVLLMPINDTGFRYFLPLVYVGYAFRNIDYKQVCKVFVIAQLFIILVRMCLIHLGVISEEIISLEYKTESGILYHDLGYGNPNSAGMVFFFLVVSLHIVLYDTHKWFSFILIILVSLFALNYTASRTSFLTSILLLSTYVISPLVVKTILHNKYFLFLIPFLIISPLFFSNWILSNYEEINDLLSGRIYIVYLLMELFKTPMSLLTGIVIEDEGIPVDNVFCYMLINYGIVAILVFIFQYIKLIRKRYDISIVIQIPLLLIIVSGFGEASWAAFGGVGSSLFWILLCNQTYYSAVKE